MGEECQEVQGSQCQRKWLNLQEGFRFHQVRVGGEQVREACSWPVGSCAVCDAVTGVGDFCALNIIFWFMIIEYDIAVMAKMDVVIMKALVRQQQQQQVKVDYFTIIHCKYVIIRITIL